MAESAATRRWLIAQIAPILEAATPTPWTWTPPGAVAAVARITNGVAPSGMPYPFVRLDLLSPGNDAYVLNGAHIGTDTLWLIKAVAAGNSTAAIEAVVDAIHAVLHWQSGSVTGGRVIDCRRERPHERKEDDNGTFYINLGGEYRVFIQEAP